VRPPFFSRWKSFQSLELFFAFFPTIGKNIRRFSNDWKKLFGITVEGLARFVRDPALLGGKQSTKRVSYGGRVNDATRSRPQRRDGVAAEGNPPSQVTA